MALKMFVTLFIEWHLWILLSIIFIIHHFKLKLLSFFVLN